MKIKLILAWIIVAVLGILIPVVQFVLQVITIFDLIGVVILIAFIWAVLYLVQYYVYK